MDFVNLSFKNKVFILLALPLLSFFWLSISSINENIVQKHEMDDLSHLVELATVYSNLVHELQKERGETAGFIGSQGAKFGDLLQKQRPITNTRIKASTDFWQPKNDYNARIVSLHESIQADLAKLESIRRQVDNLQISLANALSYYSNLNAKLLSISKIITHLSHNADITSSMVAYYNFLQGKERAGIERAVLSNVFLLDNFTPELLIKFITLTSEQNTFFTNFTAIASKQDVEFFNTSLRSKAVDEVLRMRNTALSKSQTGGFNIEPTYWFAQATGRIKQLKSIENNLSDSVISLSNKLSDKANNAMLMTIAATLLIGALAIVICSFIIKNLNSRIKDLMHVLGTAREHNDLTVRAQYHDKSELGQMSQALNQTLGKFSEVVNDISSSSIALASEAEETAQTCEHSFKNIAEQQSELALVATAIEEMSATVKEVAENTQSAAEVAKNTDQKAQSGLITVQESYRSIESLADEITDLTTRIRSLHESSLNITSIVDVIKSIAEQTNLLALNAAIEAARAGEQGRGFAVVADEVRTLAQRTQDSTAEIESVIDKLQTQADSAFNVIENSQKKASAAVESSKEVEQTLDGITNSVSHIFSLTEQVAVAVEQQSVVTQEVAQNVINIEGKSLESVTGSKQISSTAQHQASLVVSLQDVARQFKV